MIVETASLYYVGSIIVRPLIASMLVAGYPVAIHASDSCVDYVWSLPVSDYTIVQLALQALVDRDIDSHLQYIDDSIVIVRSSMLQSTPSITIGKNAYVDEFSVLIDAEPGTGLTHFDLLGAASGPGVTFVIAVLHIRTANNLVGHTPSHDTMTYDLLVDIVDGRILRMTIIPHHTETTIERIDMTMHDTVEEGDAGH